MTKTDKYTKSVIMSSLFEHWMDYMNKEIADLMLYERIRDYIGEILDNLDHIDKPLPKEAWMFRRPG